MSLRDVDIKIEYRSLIDNVPKEFYVPILKEAILYKRAVGFFSSSSLVEISKGIAGLIRNGGRMKLIASPNLSEEDIEAIKKGYRDRETVIKSSLINSLKQPENDYQKDRLNYLANLISDNLLDIKIAVTENNNGIGIYHEKVGIVEDSDGNKIVFSGSMNETANAFLANYETIDVFKSWTSDLERVQMKEMSFDMIWKNVEHGVKVFEIEELNEEIISRYKKEKIDYKIYDGSNDLKPSVEKNIDFIKIPASLDFYDYQKDAMEVWIKNGCCGIFDMATGTGKTYTALGAISKLSQLVEERLAVIIVVPYIHLVEQWLEDLGAFNVSPIIAYGYSGNRWRTEFKNAVQAYNIGVKRNFCIITTNATFILEDFQNIISKFKKNFCIVADEAHNMGAEKIRKCLPKTARYRLALSATIERYRDEEGTQEIYRFFGKKCISFGLKEAIRRGFLTPYYYYPILVNLDRDELENYNHISEQIRKISKFLEDDASVNDRLELLLIKRARIIAGCRNKIPELIRHIAPYKDEYHMLVYCGATKYDRNDLSDNDEIRQIDEVNRRLYEDLKMNVRKFTSSETIEDRKEIRNLFVNESIQVITAIKCLDEGVNIPAINRAYILASSTNPKEYIQRRGRVLRKAENKKYAEIYDFITLPRPLESVKYSDGISREYDRELVDKEFQRMMDFANCSRNPMDSDKIKLQIQSVYKVEERVVEEE